MYKITMLLIAFFVFGVESYALTESNKKVGFLGLNKDVVSVSVQNVSNPGCFFNLISLGDIDGPQADLVNAWFALLLTAKTAGRTVTIDFNQDPANPAACFVTQISIN